MDQIRISTDYPSPPAWQPSNTNTEESQWNPTADSYTGPVRSNAAIPPPPYSPPSAPLASDDSEFLDTVSTAVSLITGLIPALFGALAGCILGAVLAGVLAVMRRIDCVASNTPEPSDLWCATTLFMVQVVGIPCGLVGNLIPTGLTHAALAAKRMCQGRPTPSILETIDGICYISTFGTAPVALATLRG